MERVFISHASEDAAAAMRLVSHLEANGCPCWIAPRDIPAGSTYADEIVRGIDSAEVLLYLVTEHSVESSHCESEVELAKSNRTPILTVLLDGTQPSHGLRFFLSTSQWLQVVDRRDTKWHRDVVDALERLRSRTSGDDSSPTAARVVHRSAGDRFAGRRRVLAAAGGAVVASLVVTGAVWRASGGSDGKVMETGGTTLAADDPTTTEGSADTDDQDPRAQIVDLTGEWSVQGFVDAIFERDTDIVDKYLASGMDATTLHSNAAAILYGFQGDMNNDPVALLQTFRAGGYELDEELADGTILPSVGDGLPLRFETELTPEHYTGGYQDGEFAGSLLFWIVSRAVWIGVADQDRAVLEYLISEGADCSVTLAFLDFNREVLADTAPFDELYPMIEDCSKTGS